MAAHTALYRQWRPRRFADMVGQEHVTRTLRNALRGGAAAHAYLFCGPRGTGKTSAARILAAALNCERRAESDGDACAECPSCRQVAEDRLLDVQEIDAASNRQVDDVRALRETVGYAPSAGRHKVYILDEVHMLTDASWNTLLKTLEEPPPATTFVLCTTDPQHVLGTVVSRCQRFDFRRLTGAEIEAQLARVCEAEGIGAAAPALRSVARRADGGLRDALAILEQAIAFAAGEPLAPGHVAAVLGAADDETAEALLGAAEGGDAAALFALVQDLYAEGRDMAQVCRDLLAALRDRIMEALGGGTAAHGGAGHGAGTTTAARVEWLLHTVELLAQAEGQMRRSAQPRLLLEVALVRALTDARSGTRTASDGPDGATGTEARPGRGAAAGPGVGIGRRTGRGAAGDLRTADARAAASAPEAAAAPPSAEARGAPAATAPGVPTGGGAVTSGGPPAMVGPGSGPGRPRVDHRSSAAQAPAAALAQADAAGEAGPAPSWEQFLEGVRRISRPVHAMLLNATLLGCDAGALRLGFPSKPFADRAAERAEVMERAWREVGGGPVRISCEVGGGAAAEAGPRRAAGGVPAEPWSAPPVDGDPRAAGPSAEAGGGAARPGGPDEPATRAAFERALHLFDGRPLPGESAVDVQKGV